MRGDEIASQRRINADIHGRLAKEEELILLKEAAKRLQEQDDRLPKAFTGLWISQSQVTLNLPDEAGYGASFDWSLVDLPTLMKTRNG